MKIRDFLGIFEDLFRIFPGRIGKLFSLFPSRNQINSSRNIRFIFNLQEKQLFLRYLVQTNFEIFRISVASFAKSGNFPGFRGRHPSSISSFCEAYWRVCDRKLIVKVRKASSRILAKQSSRTTWSKMPSLEVHYQTWWKVVLTFRDHAL